MLKLHRYSLGLILSVFILSLNAQDNKKLEEKKGWSYGILPAVTYNSDQGLQYGGLINFFDYADGSRYPKFDHSIYLEWSKFTYGGGINRLSYISDVLIPGVMIGADVSYVTEKAIDFYGFNGYDAVYNDTWEDEESDDYKTRMFYRHRKNMFRIKNDYIIPLAKQNWNLNAGFALYHFELDNVDPNSFANDLPDVDGIFQKYVDWGILSKKEQQGGWLTYLQGGLSYDSRDNIANPNKGIWFEGLLRYAPGPLSNGYDHSRLALTFNHYVPLIFNKLTFAYRLSVQQALHGEMPFYIMPELPSTILRSANTMGLGGDNTLRGVLRNRVVGEGYALSNIELRYKAYHFRLLKQNFYLGLNAFHDAGLITQKRSMNYADIQSKMTELGDKFNQYFNPDAERLHQSLGLGLILAMNQNFVIACDYGKALDIQDGNSGLYINLNYLF